MIILSLFDGMGCGYEALKRAGIHVTKYYASEIDKYAMQIAKKNHPDIIHLGDVLRWQEWVIDRPDLIIGGSPCQGFSFAGGQLAFDDPRSKLFFEMTDIIDYYKPRFKLLENVKMKKEYLAIITDFMNCGEPHFINSALVSAQSRQRFYWYNWSAPDPEDRGLLLRDIIIDGAGLIKDRGELKLRNDKAMCIDANYHKGIDNHGQRTLIGTIATPSNKVSTITGARIVGRRIHPETGKRDDYNLNIKAEQRLEVREDGKAGCLTTVDKDSVLSDGISYRKLTPTECERLQTLPDGYTEGVSDTQRYRMIGNGWTVEVLAHIFSHMPLNEIERMQQL